MLQLLDSIELEENADEHDGRLKGEDSFRFLHVMDRAQKDLSDALSHGRIAGRDQQQIVKIASQIAEHLRYLNEECGRIHGDIKPRNIVLLQVGDELVWMLIDLDASVEIGTPAGLKKTSSACYPPEMARRELQEASFSKEKVEEDASPRIMP